MTVSVKSLQKQLIAAIAMVLVAAIALGSSTYAWFVSNNSVTATTTQISAQSNSAYLLIEAGSKTTTSSTTSDTASEEVGEGKLYADTKLYPAQWKNSFDESKGSGTPKVYQFESAYASEKGKPDEKSGTRFAVGAPNVAVAQDYALLNTFYVGTGTYDGEFSNLKVANMTVTATEAASLKTAMRLLIMAYAPQSDGSYLSTPTSWVVAKYNDGNTATIESQSLTGDGTAGVVYAPQFGKSEGDVKIEVYAYYDGSDGQVYTTNLEQLTLCGATVTFDATPVTYGA